MTPAQLGYRMPAEWEPHRATWFTWPRPEGISFPDRYDSVPPVYAQLITQLAAVEEVHINVWDAEKEELVRTLLHSLQTPLAAVHFHHFPAYEPWCRDHGPIFLVREAAGNRERAVVDWDYNAWGGKYPPYDLDDAIPQHVARFRHLPLFSPGVVMEGGSIDVNGAGSLLTTTACLLNPNRNPNLSRREIEQSLKDYLGVRQILWLGEGIIGDDTDGHVDDLSRFTDPDTIVTVIEEDSGDENYAILQENLKLLKTFRNLDGQPFRIVTIPMPGLIQHNEQRLPASYANFYIANKRVLVPTFGASNDRRALETLQTLFPDRQVIGLDSTELIWGLGSFHCISQQEPA
ncbi:MAG TPA: agmatine deiminase family protein [Verrucomicrobiae bacterium]|nr:agmatine deiminase family protein [Verrucomicrobiae bacterium]